MDAGGRRYGRAMVDPPRLGELLPDLLARDPDVHDVELVGSRARGDAGPFSDWDVSVRTVAFDRLRTRLPSLVRPLDPLVQQWDRLSDHECYMLIVAGPAKVDLLFEDRPHRDEPPWQVDARTLAAIDDHFWDWVLWLTSKVHAGTHAQVDEELRKMHDHILRPLGIASVPGTLPDAVDVYLEARARNESVLGVHVARLLEQAVSPVVDAATDADRRRGGTTDAMTEASA